MTALTDTLSTYAPFFEATRASTGDNPRANYACLFCDLRVENGETAAVSFSGPMKRWAHVACLRQLRGAVLSTDKRAKSKAQDAASVRWKAARTATRDQLAGTVSIDVAKLEDEIANRLRAEIRQEIEATLRDQIETEIDDDYGEQIDEAIKLIEELRQENATLKSEAEKRKDLVKRLQTEIHDLEAQFVAQDDQATGPVEETTAPAPTVDDTAPTTTDDKAQKRAERAARRVARTSK